MTMVEGYKRLIKKGELIDDFQDYTWLLFRYSKCFQSGEFHKVSWYSQKSTKEHLS